MPDAHMVVSLVSKLTCPQCGQVSVNTMPEESCHFFFACPSCGALLKPKAGDCCVFCSYGSVPCPSIQRERIGQGA